MRHNETHFEQVPIGEIETALEQGTLQPGRQKKSPVLVLRQEGEVVAEFLEQEESVPSKNKS